MNDVAIVTIDNAKVRRKLRVEEVECRYFSKRLFLFDLHQKAPLNIQRCLLMHDNDNLSIILHTPSFYNLGPAATRALPASLPSYFLKFLMKRPARSLAFSSHSARF